MREKIAQVIYCKLEGPVNNADHARQTRQLAFARDIADAVLDALSDPTLEMLRDGAASVRDYYSQPGPYPRTKAMWKAMIAAIRARRENRDE